MSKEYWRKCTKSVACAHYRDEVWKGERWEACRRFGKGEEFLVTASGIEEPQHDSRLAHGLARTYKYDPTPGRHVKGGIGMFPLPPDFDYS